MKKFVIYTLILFTLVASVEFYYAESVEYIIEDVHDIDWNQLSVGDTVSIPMQQLNRWDDYKISDSSLESGKVKYLADEGKVLIDSTISGDGEIESKFEIDLSDEILVGISLEEKAASPNSIILSTGGLIEVSMRPDYLRHDDSAQWGAVNTDESVWYFEQTGNTRGYLKYKINGANKGSSLYINDTMMRNTFTIHSLPGVDKFDFAYCTMPEDDTSNNCYSEDATNVKKRSITQDYIHMNNNFLTMVLNGGTNNDLIINNINILAKVKSYSNIKIDNSAYFVETGTSLKEVHDKIDPKYYEIINNKVTHIASDLSLGDLVDDGGYDSNVPGTYTFRYSHLNGYAEGARTNTSVDVVVMDESEMIDLSANNYTTTITNAPTTKSQIKAMMGVKAIQGDEDLTESVKVSSYGGYDLANPQVGNYNVIFSVENSYGQKIYQNAWLKIVNDSNVENVSIDTQLIYDQSGDSKVSIDENVSYQVTITNNSNVYLNNALIEYDVNKNYFDLDTIANIEATDNVQVKMNDSTKKLDISFNSFEVGEQAVITFDVKALDNWYIYSENQELDHFMNYATLFYYDESVDYEFITELEDTAFGGFVNGFSLTDESGDNLITENEEVYVEHTFYNDSIYSLFTVEFNNEETVDKLTQDYAVDLKVESDKRELVEGIDYDVVGEEQIFIDEVVPSERITVSYTVLSTATFHNPGTLKMNVQSNIWIENRSALYSSEKLKDSIPLDLEKLVNYDISTKLKDSNDGFAAPNELIILEIDVKNTGLIDSNNNVITIDLEDINVVEDILSESMINVETSSSKAVKTAKVAGKGKFTLVDNQITINSISAGSSVKILVGLTVESIIDISNFNLQLDEKPVITESVNIKSNIYDEQSYEPEIEIDVIGNSSINEDLTFEESTGDGDGIIDPGEQFTLKLDLVNDGQVNLDHLLVDLDIDKNLAVSEYDVVPKYYVDDVVSEDYTITMVDGKKQIELTKFPVGQKSTIEITIVYGDSVSNQISKNEIHLNHKYLETIDIYANLEVDLNNNRNINVDVVTDKVSVKPGDKVSYAIEIANDGLTTEENIIVKYNVDNKNLLINNIQNLMIVDSQNNVLTRNEDYIVTNDYITINKLEMNEKYTLTFDLSIANPMYIDYLLGEDYTIKSSVLTKFNFGLDFTNELEFTPDLSDYTITPDASFKTVNGDSVVRPKDFVEFKFTLENDMPVKMTNFKLNIDASDLALINFNIKADSTDENLQYNIDKNNSQVSLNTLPSGETVTITATGQVTADFDTSETLDIVYDYSADFIEPSSETLSINKEIESYTSAALESSLISTSSGNMLVGPDEDLFIDLHLINTGLADIEHLSLEFSESSDFIESLELIEIVDETGKKLDASEYTFNKVIDSKTYMLDIDYMYVYKDYTIKLKASTLSDLEYQPNLEFVTTLSAKYIDEEERTQLQLDSNLLGQVGLEYNMTHNDSDGDNLLDPSETITFNVVLDNYGSVSYHELIIREITNDSNLSEVINDLSVTQTDEFGVESSYGDYTQTDKSLVIDELVAHNKISVNYTLTAKEYFVKQEKVTSLIEVEFSELAGIAPIFTLSNDLKIDYKGNSSINTSATIANSNGMTSVLTGDTIEMNYNIENTGSTVLSDILIVTEYDDNINIDSVKIKSATIDDNNASSQLNLESGQITLDQLNPGEKAIITLEAKMLDKFDNSNLVTNEIKIRPITSVDNYVENTASINIDRSKLEQPKVTIENYEILYDDGDNLLDPNENVAVLIKVENQNDMAINNIVVDYSNYSNNYLSLSASSDSAIVNEAEKTIEKSMLKAKSSFTVELNAETKSKFNSDKFASIQNLISYEEFNDDQVDLNLEIDLDDNTSVETTMTLSDATLDNYASAGEIITIDYSLSNVGNRDLSNLLISDITTDKNVNESISNIKLYIDDVEQTIAYSDEAIIIDQLNVGQTVNLKFDVVINSILQRPIFKIILFDIDIKLNATDSIESFNVDTHSQMRIDPSSSELKITTDLIEEVENNLIDKDEKLEYEIEVENTGVINLEQVSIDVEHTGILAVDSALEVYNSDMDLLTVNDDYTYDQENGIIKIENIEAKDNVTIILKSTAPSTFTSEDTLNYRTLVTHSELDNINVLDKYEFNTEGLHATKETMTINGVENDANMEQLINSQFDGVITLENNGMINERNVIVSLTSQSPNLDVNWLSFKVTKNGSSYTSSVIVQNSSDDGISLIIPEFNIGDTIKISVSTKIGGNIIDLYEDDTIIPVHVASEIVYDETYVKYPEYNGAFNKANISSTDLEATVAEKTYENGLINANELMEIEFVIKNDNYLQQDDVHLDVEYFDENIDINSIILESFVDQDGNSITADRYSWTPESLYIDYIPANTTYTVTFSWQILDQLELPPVENNYLQVIAMDLSSKQGLLVNDKQVAYAYDGKEDNVSYSLEYIGSQSVLKPGDDIDILYTIENNGSVHNTNVRGYVDVYEDGGVDYEDVRKLELTRNNNQMSTDEFDYDNETHSVNIHAIYPGDEITLLVTYGISETPFDINQVIYSSHVIDATGKKIKKWLDPAPAIDLSGEKLYNLESSITYEDVDSNEALSDGEEVTYTVDIFNDGTVNYSNLDVYIDLSDFDIDQFTYTAQYSNDAQELDFEQIKMTNNLLQLQLHHVLIDENIIIEVTFNANDPKLKNNAKVSVISSLDEQKSESSILGPEVDLDNQVDAATPYITGSEKAQINESEYLTDAQLLELFEIESNEIHMDGFERYVTVEHSIDYNQPATYDVIFTITDSQTPPQKAQFTGQLVVNDLQPVIESKDSVKVSKGEVITDFMTLLDVSATEITNGDLNAYVTFDDSNVNYNQVGSYEATLSVNDNENNIANKSIEVNVVNSLYPELAANDIYLTVDEASKITTDVEIMELMNVSAYNYDGTNLTNTVTITNDSNFIGSEYSNGDEFDITFMVKNSDQYSQSITQKITISDEDIKLTINSITPITIAKNEVVTLDDISNRANINASIFVNDELTKEEKLTSMYVTDSNLDFTSEGAYFVNYKYIDSEYDISASYIQQVNVVNNDTNDIDISVNFNDQLINPGDVIEGEIIIANNSQLDRSIDLVEVSTADTNVNGIEFLSNDSQKKLNNHNSKINNLALPHTSVVELRFKVNTNELFTYTNNINFITTIIIDGHILEQEDKVEVNENNVDIKIESKFSQDEYTINDKGTLVIDIKNIGTMDSNVSTIDLKKSLKNTEIKSIYVDNVLVEEKQNLEVKAKSSMQIEINFLVLSEIVFGEDILTFFNQLGNEISFKIPVVKYIVSTNDNNNQNGNETNELKKNSNNEEESDTTTIPYKMMSLLSTGKGIAIVLTSLFSILICIILVKRKFVK